MLIPFHCIYDVKYDGKRKCRPVVGGQTNLTTEDVFSGIVNIKTVRIMFVLAAMNDQEVCANDNGNAYINKRIKEMGFIIAAPKFGEELMIKRMLIFNTFYGLK